MVFSVAHGAEAPDGVEAVRSLAQAGAVQLALRRVDALQPAVAAPIAAPARSGAPVRGASWVEWEDLRLQLLARLGRNDEVLQRAAMWPPAVTAGANAGLHVTAARAALTLGRTTVARDHAGRALWSPGLANSSLRELRLLVIQSYVRDARGDDAYRSMLRFEQDYRPLDAATATVFVDALLDLKMAREAVAWLTLLDERGPVKLRLRLHTGVITSQDAIVQARAALGRSEDPAWWRVLLEAAERQNNGALRLTAMEQLLETGTPGIAEAPDADAGKLWETYPAHARAAANSHQLLAGDDASWLEFAARRRAAEAAEARAYLAYLARYARDPGLQQKAQAQLAADFAAAKLPRAGLRIFAAWMPDAAALAVPTRHTLGAMAETTGDHARALRYWQGLPAPDNMPPAIWNLRLSALALRAGRADTAVEIAKPLAAERTLIPAVQLPEWQALAQQFADHGLHDTALALYERLLPQADAAQLRRLLIAIARSHEAREQPLLAADFYLRSVLQPPTGDAAVSAARLQAAFNLARAGLRDDAKAQFEWVMKNAIDPAQIAIARRELGF